MNYKNILLATLLCLCCHLTAPAKIIQVPRIYAFGFAASFNDTIVHFTDVHEIDNAWIDNKTNFLLGRENYSAQLRNYLSTSGMPHRTCIIVSSQSRADVEKQYLKFKRKYTTSKDGLIHFDVRYLTPAEFRFTAVDMSSMLEQEEAQAEKPKKPSKKPTKQGQKGAPSGK